MKKIIIEKNKAGERIDKFLTREFFSSGEATRGDVIRNIKDGNILANNQKIKPSYILKENDAIEIDIPAKEKNLEPNKNVKFEIIFEDENIIAVNKPAGLQVHPVKSLRNHGASPNQTLANGLLYKFPEIAQVGDDPENRPGIVHRLDRDTSGIMVIARNQKTFLALKEKFKNREIKKKYRAIVFGKLEKKSGIIDKPIAKAKNYKKQIIAGKKTLTKSREAQTEYKVLKEFENYSLVEATPKTGRTHQIRIHLASLGNPVLGDEKYRPKNIKPEEKAGRQLLHAKHLAFELFGKKYNFNSELPDDFESFLTKVE